MSLTGRFCFRRSWLGKVVLMVEEEKPRWPLSKSGETRKRWRDASLMDLTHHELRRILELRDRTAPPVEQAPTFVDASPRKRTVLPLSDAVGWSYAPREEKPIRLNGH